MAQISDINMTDINEAALSSIENYRRIEQIYSSMLSSSLEAAAIDIDQKVEDLADLFREVSRTDSLLIKLVNNNSTLTDTTHTLLHQHGQILNQVHKQNQSLAVKANSVKSLLHHELSKINTGRSAINGYKPISTESKRIITGSL